MITWDQAEKIGTAIGALVAVVFGVWNKFGIKNVSLQLDGLLLKYVKAEKYVSDDEGHDRGWAEAMEFRNGLDEAEKDRKIKL